MGTASAAALGAIVFASSNIDDVLVLLGFFADSQFKRSAIVLGQYLGIGALYLTSAAASLVSLVLDPAYVGLLGVVPIALGVAQLVKRSGAKTRHRTDRGLHPSANPMNQTLVVAAVTIANGADNLAIYVPLFGTVSAHAIAVIGVVFVIMTGVWCAVAFWLVRHPMLGAPIRRHGRRAMPFVLIGLGMFVLIQAGSRRLQSTETSSTISFKSW
jgi:cadmium resistance protein CadD (predicted permease)